jgi:hypothetical protein
MGAPEMKYGADLGRAALDVRRCVVPASQADRIEATAGTLATSPAADLATQLWFLLESVERLGCIGLPESASRPGSRRMRVGP